MFLPCPSQLLSVPASLLSRAISISFASQQQAAERISTKFARRNQQIKLLNF